MTTNTTTTEAPAVHVTIGQATTVHTALVHAGEIMGANCAWYGSTGPKKRNRVTTAPLTCKKCIKAAEGDAALTMVREALVAAHQEGYEAGKYVSGADNEAAYSDTKVASQAATAAMWNALYTWASK